MTNNYKVYAHINKTNGKIYIGQTGQCNVKDRWDSGHGYKSCIAFNNAIEKYGWNNFEHIVIFENLTLEMSNILEVELIKKYKTTNSRYGYNIDSGGRNRIVSQSTREKLRKAHLGTKLSEKTKQKIREYYKANKHPWQGKHHSEITKQKISESNKGKPNTPEQIEKQRLRMIGEGNPFYGKHHSEDTKKIIGEKAKERYTGEGNPFFGKCHSEESKKKMSEAHRSIPKEKHGRYGKTLTEKQISAIVQSHNKEVIQYDKYFNEIQRFESTVIAARHIGCSSSAISKCCTRVNKTCKGYIFLYADELEEVISKSG